MKVRHAPEISPRQSQGPHPLLVKRHGRTRLADVECKANIVFRPKYMYASPVPASGTREFKLLEPERMGISHDLIFAVWLARVQQDQTFQTPPSPPVVAFHCLSVRVSNDLIEGYNSLSVRLIGSTVLFDFRLHRYLNAPTPHPPSMYTTQYTVHLAVMLSVGRMCTV